MRLCVIYSLINVLISVFLIEGAERTKKQLSIGNFTSIIRSQIDVNQTTFVMSWNDMNDFEWISAQNKELCAQNQFQDKCGYTAFIVCHTDDSETSGISRLKRILEFVEKTNLELELSQFPIYNKQNEGLCLYGYMLASTASRLAQMNDQIIIQPLPAEAKMRPGIFDDPSFTVRQENTASNKVSKIAEVNIHIDLCPGAMTSASTASKLSIDFIQRLQDVIETEANKHIRGRSLMAKSFFWTSLNIDSEYSKTNSTIDRRLETNQVDHAIMWESIIQDASNPTFDCANFIRESIVKIYPRPSQNSYSFIYKFLVQNDHQKVCVDFFVLGVASQSEVCSVEKQDSMRLHNDYAQWILQSGEIDQRPFFDKGLTGLGQVVQVGIFF